MVTLTDSFTHLGKVKILLIGDFMLDQYTFGHVKRISPEAPVPVLHVQDQYSLPGGAGNVALNLLDLGAEVTIFGRIGDDESGFLLKEELEKRGCNCEYLLVQKDCQTPLKNRLISSGQQLIRVDFEAPILLEKEIEEKLKLFLEKEIDSAEALAISDYGKGLLTEDLLTFAIDLANQKSIVSVVDPKGEHFARYRGATLLKPNEKEAYAAAYTEPNASFDDVGKALIEDTQVDMLLITRSKKGMTLFSSEKRQDFPVEKKDVIDVTGAGDTALAMVTVGLANQIPIERAIQLANIASGVAVEKLGCVSVKLSEIAHRLLAVDPETKLFDENYLFVLEKALADTRPIILHLTMAREMTPDIFYAIKDYGNKKENSKLIVYLNEEASDRQFITILCSMNEVDFVVLETEDLAHLCKVLNPLEVHEIGEFSARENSDKHAFSSSSSS